MARLRYYVTNDTSFIIAILFPAAALSVAFIPSTTTKRSLFRATTTLFLPSSSLRCHRRRPPLLVIAGLLIYHAYRLSYVQDLAMTVLTIPIRLIKFLISKPRNALRPLLRSNSDAAVISASQRAFATLDGIPKTNGIAAICDNDNCSSNYIVK